MEDGSLQMQSTGPKKGSEVWYVFQRTDHPLDLYPVR